MLNLYEVKKYIQYKLNAANEHGIHSPFVYTLYTEVITQKNNYYAFDELAKIREQLLKNTEIIEVLDLGAGSKKMNNKRLVKDIAKYSIAQKKYGELLFRLVNHFHPSEILELGTSLGLSTLYMTKAYEKATITSIEGCPNTFFFAKNLIERNTTKNIHLINTPFDGALTNLPTTAKFDFVYIDGNHTYEATMRYFNILLKHIDENSVLLFDDIYWSTGMTKAWEEIKNHSAVTLSIDLYKIGVVFFRKENKQKEHFILNY